MTAGLLSLVLTIVGISAHSWLARPAGHRTAAPARGGANPNHAPRVPVTQPLTGSGLPAGASPPPAALEIPKLGVNTRVVPLGLHPDSSLETPSDPSTVGWFDQGPAPGDPGPAVILGHRDSDSGPAVFWRLSELAPGDLVTVTRSDESVLRYRVTALRLLARAGFPDTEVYGAEPDSELRLITCDGHFNVLTRQYSDNLVVFATLSP